MSCAGEEATKIVSAIAENIGVTPPFIAETTFFLLQYYDVVGKLARSVMHLGTKRRLFLVKTGVGANKPTITSVTSF